LVIPENAISEDYTCYLESRIADLHISVYNVFPAGTVGKRTWKGVIKEEEQILLKSRFGRIYYEYSTNPEVQSSMVKGLVRSCRDNKTVIVP
jgi:hypothetical protein